jgi:hypothetical protein
VLIINHGKLVVESSLDQRRRRHLKPSCQDE